MDISYQLPLPTSEKEKSSGTFPIDSEFDVEFANEMARLESYNKHLYRPNTYLHKWWARRCGSTFRLILKHFVQEETKRFYYAPGGLEGKIVLDPMMGGGTTVHEAIRLGANVIGADIDPIPFLQARASLADVPLQRLEYAFDLLYESLQQRIGRFFVTRCPLCDRATNLKYVLYGAKRRCKCGTALSIDSMVLRYNADGSTVRICPECHHIVMGDSPCECSSSIERPRLVEKDHKQCSICGDDYEYELELPFYARYIPLAVVGECEEHGLFFKEPKAQDLSLIGQADELRDSLGFRPSEFLVETGPKSIDLIHRGVTNYLDLFSSRQLLYLHHAIEVLSSFDPMIRLNLALLVSTSLEFNSMLCGYKGGGKRRPGAIRHTFSHHAYSFPHTALENNVLFPGKASGTLRSLFHYRIRRAREWALAPRERQIEAGKTKKVTIRGEVDVGTEVDSPEELKEGSHRFLLMRGSSASLNLHDDSVDFVVTDPPYFDSVQYSDLATFFHVWLRQLLPVDVDWCYDRSQSAVNPQDSESVQYRRVLSEIFRECHRVLDKNLGRLVFTFHHWNPTAWSALTAALQTANFVLVNRYIVHSENPISVHISNLNALKHDAVLILAPREAGIGGSWTLPSQVDMESSADFCRDCATALGWMLDEGVEEDDIEMMWKALLAV
jgi:DNA modification methylase